MEAFPFTDAEWEPLKDLADSILNAHSADDEVLWASLRLEMLDLLGGLQKRHGDHPVLLETMADYMEDAAERIPLYRRAAEIAEAHGLPTLSIRLALTNVLVHDLGDSVAALEELHGCGSDAPDGCEIERREWASLLAEAAIEADAAERASMFRRAMEIATAHGQSALRLRLLFIRFLLDEEQPEGAREELRACDGEASGGNEEDRTFWAELCREASQAEPGAAADPAPKAGPGR